jgi:hypothetical protein
MLDEKDAEGCVITAVVVIEQLLTSFTTTEYVPALKPLAVKVV